MFVAALLLHQLTPVRLVRDGAPYLVKVVPKAERPLQVWRSSKLIAFGLLKRYHPWCLQVADVDGRGDAIAVGVDKPTHNLHFPHRTLFLLSFDGKALKRKWTGSTMGRPLLEFCFSPTPPQRLITLETCLDGRVALSSYHWIGFGFRKDRERFWQAAAHLQATPDALTVRAEGHQVSLQWSDVLL